MRRLLFLRKAGEKDASVSVHHAAAGRRHPPRRASSYLAQCVRPCCPHSRWRWRAPVLAARPVGALPPLPQGPVRVLLLLPPLRSTRARAVAARRALLRGVLHRRAPRCPDTACVPRRARAEAAQRIALPAALASLSAAVPAAHAAAAPSSSAVAESVQSAFDTANGLVSQVRAAQRERRRLVPCARVGYAAHSARPRNAAPRSRPHRPARRRSGGGRGWRGGRLRQGGGRLSEAVR